MARCFSRVLEEVPGRYLMLGAAQGEDYVNAPSNHRPRATFDDSVLDKGSLLHAELAFERCNAIPPEQQQVPRLSPGRGADEPAS